MTRRLTALIAVAAALSLAACGGSSGSSGGGSTSGGSGSQGASGGGGGTTVTIQNFKFSPATLTVKAGSKITWTNRDSAEHTATADNGKFDTGGLQQNSSKTITFSKKGTYAYHCTFHPFMHGKVIVK